MDKITIAVCDSDEEYRNRFTSYLAEHKAEELMVCAYSAPDAFFSAADRNRFDVAVFGSGFTKELAENRGIPILLLSDTRTLREDRTAEGMSGQRDRELPQQEKTKELPAGAKVREVFRYQPIEAILREIWIAAGAGSPSEKKTVRGTTGIEVIGVYSPMRHEMQMPFSVVLADRLAEKEKVLYINLIAGSGFMELFCLDCSYDLGDLVLCLRNGRTGTGAFRKSVCEMSHLYYIPPFANPENLHDFSVNDYTGLLDYLEQQTDFEAVVFDFGDGLDQFAGMLARCTSIYCPMKEGFFFECQMAHFAAYLEKESGEVAKEQLNRVVLPYSARRIHGGSDVLGQLLWSEFGDYVRNYLAGGKE
ncbi:MAG: hypothetical protein HFI35_08445 [Roseburia sp.]|nr:hypothetical protein [Roseburia sp.]